MNEQLKIIISAEIGKLKDNVNKAKKAVEDFAKGGKESVKEFSEELSKYGSAANKGLAIAGTAIAGAATALLALSETTKEYRTEQAKLNAAFETAGASAGVAQTTYNDLFRVLGDSGQATEAANHLAKLSTNQQDLSQWTNICQGIYATFGDSLPIEGLTEAANETAKVGTVTGGLADALNWAGVSEDEFNEKLAKTRSEAEREKLIRETLNGLYSEAAANYEENAAGLLEANEAQAKFNEATAKLGEVAEPIMTTLKELGADVLTQLAPYLQEFGEKYLPQIKDSLSDVGDKIGKVITWIADNWTLVSTLAAIITGIAVALSVFSAVMAVVNAVMMISPVTWIVLAIVAAVAALVAIIVLVIKYWDEIKAATVKVWNAIVDAVKVAIDWVIDLFTKIFNWVKENWLGLLLLLVNPFSGAFKLLYDNCEGFRNFIDNWVQKIKDFFVGLWNGIKDVFAGVGKWFADVFTAAWNGIKKAFSAVTGFFTGIWDKIKSIFTNVGGAIAEAVGGTVKKAINGVLSMAIKIINNFISAINLAIGIINAIPGVSIKKLSKLEVPQLAKGGIVDSATLAVVGEAGKEAIVPLENNLGWLDKMATMLGERMGGGLGGAPIYLMVDKKVLAEVSVEGINGITRQTGNIPLVIA